MPKARDCYEGEVPFDNNGNMMDYGEYGVADRHPVKPFTGNMKVVDWQKGRSAVRIWVQAIKGGRPGIKYPMFMADFWAVIQKYDIIGAVISGVKWTVCKKGANYGIKEYKP